MRAPERQQVGSLGATLVKAAFERIGWGVAVNPEHDLGTDLFAMARDERRFELGQVVGVQVKSGRKKYFKYPSRRGGVVVGWWFREDNRDHFDDWLNHSLPHLIVLHHPVSEESYWAHITQDAVRPAGKGAKIFVPAANTIDAAHLDALLQVAATSRAGLALEGSVWTGATSLAPKDRLRHALIVPRLIAPHPNAGFDEPVGPEEAVALLMEARFAAFQHFADRHGTVPTLTEAIQTPDWGWRFFGALGKRLTTGDFDHLQTFATEDTPSAVRAAITAMLAAELVEAARPSEAVQVLEAELDRDEAEPVDYAWLKLQHARACVEIGRLADARDDAAFVQRLRITHPDDVTATAIAGVAAMIVFSTTPWPERDIGAVIQGADTAAAWWRTQAISEALSSFADRTFESWSHDTSIHLDRSDPVNDSLLTAALTANYVGDHGAWRHLYALLGRDKLVRLNRNSDHAEARAGLDRLRLAGDDKALTLAVRQLVIDGPATAVTRAAADVDLDRSTRTTGRADLALLQHGGDLLDAVTAGRVSQWLLKTLLDPSAFIARTGPSALVRLRLIDTLAGVVPAAPPEVRDKVMKRLVELPAEPDQAQATSWARVAEAMPQDA